MQLDEKLVKQDISSWKDIEHLQQTPAMLERLGRD